MPRKNSYLLFMFIREVKKKNQGYNKEFIYHRLMESYRTERGPRQRTILDLGKLELPKEQWKLLADRIEAQITKQHSLLPVDEEIENLATHYANLIIQKRIVLYAGDDKPTEKPDYETIDLKSISHSHIRTIGAEYVGLSTFRKLGLETFFKRFGLGKNLCDLAALSIVGKLVHPASERSTREWARNLSGLDVLLNTDFTHLSNNALYRISDLLISHKAQIEKHLRITERNLFSLKEKIILYDLTNTYFEGDAKSNPKAKRGRSKEKRYDRPLVTLGFILDEMGFPKASKIFAGNASEPKTLLEMIEKLQGEKIEKPDKAKLKEGINKSKKDITVVVDAGIATQENLDLLKFEGYDYICVARNQPIDPAKDKIKDDNFITIKQDKTNKVEAQLIRKDGESILYCKSYLKGKKEEAMRTQFQKRFEKGLTEVAAALSKKGGTKTYDKVMLRIGRLKEKYASIAHYYEIKVDRKDGIVPPGGIAWEFEKKEKAQEKFSGTYFLRTSRTDLNEQEIWHLYVMLTNVEDAFRYLKDELGLRPVFHRIESRVDAHLFITVLAYHLLISIQTQLERHGIYMRWWHVRKLLSSHACVTTSMTNQKGEQIHIRQSSDPEPFHRSIYNALGLSHSPIKAKRVKS